MTIEGLFKVARADAQFFGLREILASMNSPDKVLQVETLSFSSGLCKRPLNLQEYQQIDRSAPPSIFNEHQMKAGVSSKIQISL